MKDPYSRCQQDKEISLLEELSKLTQYHCEHCPDYARLVDLFYQGWQPCTSLADLPYLPVNLFKMADLLSVKAEEVFKILKSSGTTSTSPSKIFLDAPTAKRQTKALVEIMTSFLGEQRLPMLIIDHAHVIKDRHSYSARGAAIVGMMTFGRDFFYALDDKMNLDSTGVQTWLQKHQQQTILVFGMTFMVWKHFLLQVESLEVQNGILMHTGGWKKMQEEAIDNALFKKKLREKTGISRCHNFYGMVEQVGNVFMECEQGYLHCPYFSDVIIRDPISWEESQNEGVIQVLSTLPTSYPGHSLLTEDSGVLLGVDDCFCGRKGKYFRVVGRIPQAEIRGCSDTYATEGAT